MNLNPTVVFSMYGTALVLAPCLFVVYAYRMYKQDKQNPPPPVKLSDHGGEERLARAAKYIKVICRD